MRPPERSPSLRGVVALASRLGVIQIDSVNVLARAHYLPVFSRLGAYPREWLDVLSSVPPRRLFEYWGHEASLLPVEAYPLFRWRMARAHLDAWGGMRRIMTDRPDLPDALLAAVAAEGPVTAAELEQHHGRTGAGGDAWGWRWSEVKRTLEYLFWAGELCSAGRGPGFERRYDLPERVLPARVLAMPVPDAPDAIRRLVDVAARAHGVATAACLRDYFRLPVAECRTALAELVDAGQLRPVTVDGWTDQAFLHPDTVVPRRACGRALLAPFDPLVWSRRRVQRLFGFAYRLEIYVPAAQRVHGYYVLPFLLGDRLVGRVDLKADRATGRLLAASSWVEPDAPPDTAPELARALREMADWLELDAVVVHPRGDLAADLTQSVAQLAG